MDQAGFDGWLARARRHDPQALATLVETYSPRVFGLLYRLTGSRETAEDLAQETFLRVVRAIDEYVHTGRFEVWLFRIAANLARDRARSSRRRGVVLRLDGSREEAGPIEVRDGSASDPRVRLEQAEDAERLNACLDSLPELDREIILLRHFSELSFKEIAEMLDIPLGTALARAHRALARLKQEFGEAG
ncbi:MAG: RNA polymerase sigma24 factor [Planctomycetota bacterium]